jgi:hypothetical protein
MDQLGFDVHCSLNFDDIDQSNGLAYPGIPTDSTESRPVPSHFHIYNSLSNESPPMSPQSSTGSESIPIADDSPVTPTTRRVHFRPRVHIASGLHHYRVRLPPQLTSNCPNSKTSSRSASPSSSISVPLRSPTSEEECSPLWGPLGQRVSFFAWKRRVNGRVADWKERQRQKTFEQSEASERTPLMATYTPSLLGRAHDEDEFYTSQDEEEAERVESEMDLYFGKMPGRLLNFRVRWLLYIKNCKSIDHLLLVVVVAHGALFCLDSLLFLR